jgi:hypothetical protein
MRMHHARRASTAAFVAAMIFLLTGAAYLVPLGSVVSDLAAAPASRTFLLRACNKTQPHNGTVDLAVASLTVDLQHFRVIGWVVLPNSNCIDVGQFQKPGVFLYAMTGTGAEIGGDGTVLCVNTRDKFDYGFAVDAKPPCPANYVPKGFALLELPDLQIDGFTFTIE